MLGSVAAMGPPLGRPGRLLSSSSASGRPRRNRRAAAGAAYQSTSALVPNLDSGDDPNLAGAGSPLQV